MTGVFSWLGSGSGRSSSLEAGGIRTNRDGKKYWATCINGDQYLSHRLAFLYMEGFFPEGDTDHIDGNGLNNKWVNLREVTNQENQMNKRLYLNNTSGFTGVSWYEPTGKWHAYININGKLNHIGYFTDKQEAITARRSANIEHGYHENHGESRPL